MRTISQNSFLLISVPRSYQHFCVLSVHKKGNFLQEKLHVTFTRLNECTLIPHLSQSIFNQSKSRMMQRWNILHAWGKGKGKVFPRTGHEDPEREQMYSSTLPSTSALDGMGGQRHARAALPPGMTWYPLYRRLGGPQVRSGQVQKISPRTVQSVASRYSDCAKQAPHAWGRSEMHHVFGWNGNGSQRYKSRVDWILVAQDRNHWQVAIIAIKEQNFMFHTMRGISWVAKSLIILRTLKNYCLQV